MTTRKLLDYTARLEQWAEEVTSSREQLLKVELSVKGSPNISLAYLASVVGVKIHRNTRLGNKKVSDPVDSVYNAMVREGIIKEGYTASACEWRRKLLNWYESKTLDEKKEIVVFGNRIQIRGYMDRQDGFGTIVGVRSTFDLVRDTIKEIEDDMCRVGFLDTDYVAVKDRVKPETKKSDATLALKLAELKKIKILTVKDIIEPSEPFEHLLHAFTIDLPNNGRSRVNSIYKYTCEALVDAGFKGYEPLEELMGVYTLPRIGEHLKNCIILRRISTLHATNLLSGVRVVMKLLTLLKGYGVNTFIDAPGFEGGRETDIYKPYSLGARSQISRAICAEIEETNALMRPYVMSGIGEDPLDEASLIKHGYGTVENARWIFENRLDCKPVVHGTLEKENVYEVRFVRILSRHGLTIKDVFKSWGVLWRVDARVLSPYVARLAQVTGLNADSLLSLEIDDFVPVHDITGRPCLRYWKERSTGQKLYHLDLFHAEIAWLTSSQGKEVSKIFSDVNALTRQIRAKAPKHVKNKLFIYESSSRSKYGVIDSLEKSGGSILVKIFKRLAEDHDLRSDDGERLALSASRFRPSFVSELIERGVSIHEIQLLLGHKHISTTFAYLDRMDFNRDARNKLNAGLNKIHVRTLEEPVASVNEVATPEKPVVLFRTGLAGCRDPLDPPDFIKRLRSYKKGSPCSLFNKCLACSNSIITSSHLPELFAMQRDYKHLLAVSRVMDTPYGEVVKENLDILDSILSVDSSAFSQDELSWAERISLNVETSVIVEGMTL
jgi:integrase